ncbi:MAG: long-chain fatty acid--CoA ligase [Pseudomonadota bacterium]|nr:long-chain fatty acid--CoA ligase [Pseudomonadota bacterium]
MSVTRCLRRAVRNFPGNPATIFRDRRQTYADMTGRVARMAGALQDLGVAPGDRVAILATNSDRYLELLFALPWAGAVAVPVNTRFSTDEIRYCLEDSGTSVLFADAALLGAVEALGGLPPALATRIMIDADPAPAGWLAYEDLVAAGRAVADADVAEDQLCGIYYTAGTTSRSKGVMLSHRNLCSNAINAVDGLRFTDRSIYLHSAPMFHLADGTSTFAVTWTGGAHTFVPRFDAHDCLTTIETVGVTNAQFVPTMIKGLIDACETGKYRPASLRQILYGASPIPDAHLKRAVELLPGVTFVHGYGMTETSSIATLLDPRYTTLEGPEAARRGSCGQAGLLVDVRVVGEDGAELPRGEVGEVVMRGPNIMMGYWNKPAETAQALRDGWMHSGDLGRMDEEGFLFLVDRLKDMIKTGGENVFSVEVEGAIAAMPEISECAVIGIPDDTWGESVHAVVVPRAGASVTEAAVIAHCRSLLTHYKCPKSVEIRTTPLPLSGTGKILKRTLRDDWVARNPKSA